MDWLELAPLDAPPEMSAFAAGHPLASRVLTRRGCRTEAEALAFVDADAWRSPSPFDLPGMQTAVDRILLAARRGEQVAVWGDFDVDGQTGAAILLSALRRLGIEATTRLSVRGRESHGMSTQGVQELIRAGARLIITCDTGVDAGEAIAGAHAGGTDVIVTDHHSLPDDLPPALALINPHLLPEEHPFATLPGAGVAFLLARALAEGTPHGASPPQDEDLVALAAVADLVPLQGETRALTQRGLRRLRSEPRPGLALLLEICGIPAAELNEDTIAYTLAPRLNAPGRMADANPMVAFYLSTDDACLRPRVQEMEALLARFRLNVDEVQRAARAQLPSASVLSAVLTCGEGWDGGVLGTVAGRLADEHNKPALVISLDPRTGRGRGSGRAPRGVDLSAVLKSLEDHLVTHGGHPGAVGFSLRLEQLETFRRAFLRAVNDLPPLPTPLLEIEGALDLRDLTLEQAAEIELLAPFGKGNPPPVFMSRRLELVERAVFGRQSEHARITVRDGSGERREIVCWNGASLPLPPPPFDLAYSLRLMQRRGRPALQAAFVDARRSAPDAGPAVGLLPPTTILDDGRADPAPLAHMQKWLSEHPGARVWAEGPAAAGPGLQGIACSRSALGECAALVIWTAPPSAEVYRRVIQASGAGAVLLLAVEDAEIDAPDEFLRRLAGLVKYALRASAGKTSLAALAAAAGGRESSVLAGLDFLRCRGDLAYELTGAEDATGIQVRVPGEPAEKAALQRARARLLDGLAETRAYRAFFRRAAPADLSQ